MILILQTLVDNFHNGVLAARAVMDPKTKKSVTLSLSDWAFIEGALAALEAFEGVESPGRGWALKDELGKQLEGRALDLIKGQDSQPTAPAPR